MVIEENGGVMTNYEREECVVFFDLGDTLGTAQLSPPPRVALVAFDVFDYIPAILSTLREDHVRLGVISNTGVDTSHTINPLLEAAGVLSAFDPSVTLYSGDGHPLKDSPRAFENAAKVAGHAKNPGKCVFVGEDATERLHATRAFASSSQRIRVCPHPLLIREVLDGQPLVFIVLTISVASRAVDARKTLSTLAFVPLKRLEGDSANERIVGITSVRVALTLIDMRFGVEYLGNEGDPDIKDLYILRDDDAASSGFLSVRGQAAALATDPQKRRSIAGSDGTGLFVLVGGDSSVEHYHFDMAQHGHNYKLMPDVTLLRDSPLLPGFVLPSQLSGGDLISSAERDVLLGISDSTIQSRVEMYAGLRNVPNAPRIRSRHIHHDDNAIAVEEVAKELTAIGSGRLDVTLHRFSHEGRSLFNVVAELKGSHEELPIVLVTAHLDSTAAASPHYDPAVDVAPGADDDASGIAGVLSIAERFSELAATSLLERSVRFVFFNAEEHGLVGSQAYARSLATSIAPTQVSAVFQMDMIGFNVQLPRSWEVHAGYSLSPEVEERSVELAHILQAVAGDLAPLLDTPQIYRTQIEGASVIRDPAEGRSDHASFQKHGFAACVVSEDFFVGPHAASPSPEANPHYHKEGDQVVDYSYAADITRVVAGTALLVARGEQTPYVTPTAPRTHSTSHSFYGDTNMAVEVDIRYEAVKRASGTSWKRHAESIANRFKAQGVPAEFGDTPPTICGTINPLTGTPRRVRLDTYQAPQAATDDLMIQEALAAMQFISQGFADAGAPPQYYPDAFVQKTSANTCAVNLHQQYRGIPIFQMTETVHFSSRGLEVTGNAVVLSSLDKSVVPTISATEAVTVALRHLAKSLNAEPPHSHWASSEVQLHINEAEIAPKVVAVFALPNRPTVLTSAPLDMPIAAHLVWLYAGQDTLGQQLLYLGWFMDITMPGASAQYHVIVAAGDEKKGDILYATEASRSAGAGDQPRPFMAKVYETNPSPDLTVDTRTTLNFPRPRTDYPLPPPVRPLPPEFPRPWVDSDESVGHATDGRVVVRDFPREEKRLKASIQGSDMVFAPTDRFGADQQALNEFYFCNYMHDFFYILGFRETDGNFSGDDCVVAFAHPRAVFGVANMLTRVDGLSPTMNMGLVQDSFHTALDADVVFHEFVHGVTNRLVGGAFNVNALDQPQSRMQGEGWGDFFALTIQNCGKSSERTTTGDWVTNSPGQGIRRFPYTDGYPEDYSFIRPGGTTQVHAGGEIWCATLMHMTRLLGAELGNKDRGYHIAWQIVVDALKLVPANPSFLDSRDALLDALDDLQGINVLTLDERNRCRRAMWIAFAGFGMGNGAFTLGASIHSVRADFSVPNEPEIGLDGSEVNRPRDTSMGPNPLAGTWTGGHIDKHIDRLGDAIKKVEALPKERQHAVAAIVEAYLSSHS